MKKVITILICLVILLVTACSSQEAEMYNRLGQDASEFYGIQDKDTAINLLAEDLEQQLEEIAKATPTPTPTPKPTPTPTAKPTPALTPAPEQPAAVSPSVAQASTTSGTVASESISTTYVLNTNTKKFHKPNCSSADEIKPKNKQEYTGTRDEVINMGYVPCKRCNP